MPRYLAPLVSALLLAACVGEQARTAGASGEIPADSAARADSATRDPAPDSSTVWASRMGK